MLLGFGNSENQHLNDRRCETDNTRRKRTQREKKTVRKNGGSLAFRDISQRSPTLARVLIFQWQRAATAKSLLRNNLIKLSGGEY